MNADKLRFIFQEKLNRIRKELWYGRFQYVESEPEYNHTIAVERAWVECLSSMGCRSFGSHILKSNFEEIFNEFGADMICLQIQCEGFVFVPRELATKILVLGDLP